MSHSTAPAVRLAGDAEWGQLGGVLGEAFWDDPMWSWMAPEPARRQRHLGSMFSQLIRRRVAEGTAWTTDDLGGVAVWAPPGRWRTGLGEQLRLAGPFIRTIGPRLVRSRLTALSKLERLHPDEPHWYLEVVGSDRNRRGQGIGSALLAPMIARCDEEGVPAYLESSKQENLAFYARFGFTTLDEVRLHPECPPVWPMWRTPR